MKFKWSFLLLLLVVCVTSCDEATKNSSAPVIDSNGADSTPQDTNHILPYNLESRIKSTDDLTSLYAAIEESPIINQFTKEKGPFTLFAPSNEAIEDMNSLEEGILIEDVLKKYMVKGKITTVALTKKIRSNGGSYSMNTIGGTTLVAYKVGNIIYLKNLKGDKAEIGKSDIVASNGIIHVVESPLDI